MFPQTKGIINQFYLTTHNSKEIEREIFLQGEIQLKKGLLSGFCVTMFHMHGFFAIQEIKEALIEERTDIMADPVLHEACSRSVTKHCDGVSHGRGRSRFSVKSVPISFKSFKTLNLPICKIPTVITETLIV